MDGFPPTQNTDLRSGVLTGSVEQPQGMEPFPATCTAISANKQKLAGSVEETVRTGRTYFDGSAMEALRNLVSSNHRDDQEHEHDGDD